MQKLFTLVTMCALAGLVSAANLTISGQTGKTYDGGTYGQLSISNSSNITVKNCTFRTPSGTGKPVSISGSNNITIDNCEIDGNKDACALIGMGGSYITIKNCFIHNAADDGVECHGGHHLYFYNNVMGDLHGCGTDGGCGTCYNGHSDGWELANVQDAEFIGNFTYNIKSTSSFFLGNWSADAKNNRRFLLANNIFYPHYAGYVIYMHNINEVELYNNTFWKGSSGGMVLANSALNMTARNNIFSSVNLHLYGTTFSPTNHDIDYNAHGLVNQGFPLQAHTYMMPNPAFERAPFVISDVYMTNPKPEDFALKAGSPAIGKGTSGGNIPDTDFFGKKRSIPYDLGAIEHGATSAEDMDRLLKTLTKVGVYPNPARTHTEVYINRAGVRPVGINVIASDGRCVWSTHVPDSKTRVRWNIDRPRNHEGMYIIALVYPTKVEYRKVVVAR
jgi:hypothetical protein